MLNLAVFSTSVEVFPILARLSTPIVRLLHVRGGVSTVKTAIHNKGMSSPRPWRCFHNSATSEVSIRVFSTSVEVFLNHCARIAAYTSLLHVRGGVSVAGFFPVFRHGSSPRPWRCFWEVDDLRKAGLSLLHVRGGVSCVLRISRICRRSSPRPWRCFQGPQVFSRDFVVFSTSVEVFLPRQAIRRTGKSLLHVRGGVSFIRILNEPRSTSSPRPWRCFSLDFTACVLQKVFSTSVEVFPHVTGNLAREVGLLHVRGGVSYSLRNQIIGIRSSPRPWRCFCSDCSVARSVRVFSTSVEVFLRELVEERSSNGLLHVRGGVSEVRALENDPPMSSPRPWRCFSVKRYRTWE